MQPLLFALPQAMAPVKALLLLLIVALVLLQQQMAQRLYYNQIQWSGVELNTAINKFIHAHLNRGLSVCYNIVTLLALVSLIPSVAYADRTVTSVTLNGGSSVSVAPSATISAVVNVTTDSTGSSRWRATGWLIASSPPGANACFNHTDHDSAGAYSEAFNITAPAVAGTYNAYFIAYSNSSCNQNPSSTYTLASAVIVVPPAPYVTSINRSTGSAIVYTSSPASWTVIFDTPVTGVDAADFSLIQTGGATGASITSVSGSGTTWTVTANSGTGLSGSLGLNLVDNDSIINTSSVSLGGAGAGNGNFTGQTYTLLPPVCTGASDILFCDDFERSSLGSVGGNSFGNWTVTPSNPSNCTGATGNTGCAGIDSDIPPFNTYSNPRANPTRSMFTRWNTVSVDSPVISLAGKAGAQLSFWMRRGRDTFSECPEAAGENYLVQYYASNNTWKTLAQYPSSPSSALCDGQIFLPVIELPADALHAGFKMRFYQPSGSGQSGAGGAPSVIGYDYWHMDDVVIREKAEPSYVGAFCDNFEAGLARWSISAEGAPTGANIGDAAIGNLTYQSASNSLTTRWGYVSAATFKTDLTGVSGNISYWVRNGTTTARKPATNQNLVAEYLNSSGDWITLATYPGSAAVSTTYNASFTLPTDAIHSNFRLRFIQAAGSSYDKSYWHVDDVCVGNLLPTADLALTKIGGDLVPGSDTTYTLKVKNNGPEALSGSMEIIDTLPSGLSYLAGNGTGWVCSANAQKVTCNWTGTLSNGAIAPDLTLTVSVGAGVSGSVTNTATVTGSVNDNVPSNNTSSYTSGSFIPSYVFTDKACPDGVAIGTGTSPCNLITNWSPQTAGIAKTGIYITAVNTSGIPTKLSASSPTSVDFQFGLTCHDPIANAGVSATFTGASPSTLALCTGGGAEPTSWTAANNLSFAAGSPSVATPYTFNYADVGEVELFMRNATSTSQKGTSGKFVVKPAGFVLSEIKPTANLTGRCAINTSPAPALACSTNATGNRFVSAGESFSVTVTAINSLGNSTPNYGHEIINETVTLTPTLVSGLGLTYNPNITGSFSSFNAGISTGTDFKWSEVGIITLTPSIGDGDYLNKGDVIGTTTSNVGRFYPAHFSLQSNTIDSACSLGSFSYMGQPFTVAFNIEARSVDDSKTSNYNGAFAPGLVRIQAENANSGSSLLSRLSSISGSWLNGAYTVSDNSVIFSRPLTTTPDGTWGGYENLALGVSVTDEVTLAANLRPYLWSRDMEDTSTSCTADTINTADGTCSAKTIGSTKQRFGRLRMSNSFGTGVIKMPVTMQYWGGSTWMLNSDDSCSIVPLSAVNSSNASVTPSCVSTPTNYCDTTTPTDLKFINGKSYIKLTPSITSGTADICIDLGATAGALCVATPSGQTYLQGKWPPGTAYNNDPKAKATFGIYAPESKKTVHIREQY